MTHYSRRDFLKTGLATVALAGAGSLPLRAARETAHYRRRSQRVV